MIWWLVQAPENRAAGARPGGGPLVLPAGRTGQRHGHAAFVAPILQPVHGLVPVVGDLRETAPGRDADGGDGDQRDQEDRCAGPGDGPPDPGERGRAGAVGPAPGDHEGQVCQAEDDRQPDERVELVDVAEGREGAVEQLAHVGREGPGEGSGEARDDDRGSHEEAADEEEAFGGAPVDEPGQAEPRDQRGDRDQPGGEGEFGSEGRAVLPMSGRKPIQLEVPRRELNREVIPVVTAASSV